MEEIEKLKKENEQLRQTINSLRQQLEAYRQQSHRQYETDRDYLSYTDYDRD